MISAEGDLRQPLVVPCRKLPDLPVLPAAGCRGERQWSGIAARGDFSGQREGRDTHGLPTRSITMAGCLSPCYSCEQQNCWRIQ